MNRNQSPRVPLYAAILFAICLATLTVTGIANYRHLGVLKGAHESMAQIWTFKRQLQKTDALFLRLEDSLRGYFLSGNPDFLEPWHLAPEALAAGLAQLEGISQDNPAKSNKLIKLRALYSLKIKEFEECIALFSKYGLQNPAILARLNQGWEISEQIRVLESEMQDEESALLSNLRDHFVYQNIDAIWISILINGLAAFTLILFYRMIKASFIKQKIADDALKSTNDNLESIVQARTRQLSLLSHHLLNVAEEEKAKLARELHDELGSNLTAICMDISRVREKLTTSDPALANQLQRAKKTLLETIDLKRRIMDNLRPSMLDNLGLTASIQSHCEDLKRMSGLQFEFDLDEDCDDISADMVIALFRIAQESLNNVVKYAHATKVKIALTRRDSELWLQILDDGIGISKETLENAKSHGILGMRERALLLGGTFSVSRGKNNCGCQIDVLLPLPASKAT